MQLQIISPVFHKELLALARRKRFFLLRGLFIGALLAAMYLGWRAFVQAGGERDLALLGRDLFNYFIYMQFAAIFLLAPGMTASLIAVEKDRDTLPLLLISKLQPHNIVLDKLLSRLLLLLLYLAAGFPLFVCLLFFRGLEPQQIIEAYGIIFATILFCAAFGVVSSAIMNKLHTALITTYVLLLLCAGAVSQGYFAKAGPVLPVKTFFMLAPPLAMDKVIRPTHRLFQDHAFKDASWVLTPLGGGCVIFLLAAAFATLILRRRSTGQKRHLFERASRWLSKVFGGQDWMGQGLVSKIKLGRNPVRWREMHKRFFASNIIQIRTFCVLSVVTALLCVGLFLNEERESLSKVRYLPLLAGGYCFLLFSLALFAAATAFTRERENRTFDTLRVTTLSASNIVLGKFCGLVKTLMIAALLPPFALFALHRLITGAAVDWKLVLSTLVGLSLAPLIIVIGLRVSLTSRHGLGAIMRAGIQSMLELFIFVLLVSFLRFSAGIQASELGAGMPFKYLSLAQYHPLNNLLGLKYLLLIFLVIFLQVWWILRLALLIRRFEKLANREFSG